MSAKVAAQPELPSPTSIRDPRTSTFLGTLVRSIAAVLTRHATRMNGSLSRQGDEPMEAPLPLKTYTLATRPAAATSDWTLIAVTDAATTPAHMQISDGVNWLDMDGVVVP